MVHPRHWGCGFVSPHSRVSSHAILCPAGSSERWLVETKEALGKSKKSGLRSGQYPLQGDGEGRSPRSTGPLWEAGCFQPAKDKHCEILWVGGRSCAVIQTCPDLRWLLFGLRSLTPLFLFFFSLQAHVLAVSPREPPNQSGGPPS